MPHLATKTGVLNSVLRRLYNKVRIVSQGRLRCYDQALSLVQGKNGIEIGGPSDVFEPWHKLRRYYYGFSTPLPIYDSIGSLDNCNFSMETMWGKHESEYRFSDLRPPGKVIIADGSVLSPVLDNSYHFVLSSHNL